MTVQRIHETLHKKPFQPFLIHMADGNSVVAHHPDQVASIPIGRTMVVYQPNEAMSIIDLLLVSSLEFKPNPSSVR